MTVGEAIEALSEAYIGWPWDVRSVLVALVIDAMTDGRWGVA
jgi:hypothetical protein